MTSDTTPAPDGTARSAEPADAGAPVEPAAEVLAEPAGTAPDSATALQAVRPPPSQRTRLAVNVVLAAAFAVLVGGIAFAAGRATVPGIDSGADDTGSGVVDGGLVPGGPAGQVPGGVGDRPGGLGPEAGGMSIRGTVKAFDADSITIELATGTVVTIAIDSATDYHRQAGASASDVSSGTAVIVELDGLGLRVGSGATAADVTIVP